MVKDEQRYKSEYKKILQNLAKILSPQNQIIFTEITQPDYSLEALLSDDLLKIVAKIIAQRTDHDSVFHSISICGFITSLSEGDFTSKIVHQMGLVDSLFNLVPFLDENNQEMHIKVLWVLGNLVTEEDEQIN